MLRIGELADYLGVSTRTIRFYHQRGLLDEPERTAAGYRLYDAPDVMRLARVVALASAGVPLARVGELLESSDDAFAAALVEIDHDLDRRIAALTADRERLALLRAGDALCLPDVIVRFIAHLREAGVDADEVDRFRDAWILTHALYQQRIEDWLAVHGPAMFDDPGYRDISVRTFHVAELDPDHPDVAALVADSVAWVVAHWESQQEALTTQMDDPVANDLLQAHWQDKPAWNRLGEGIAAGLRAHGLHHPSFDGELGDSLR